MGDTRYEQFHNNIKGIEPLVNAGSSLDNLQTTFEQIRDNVTQALAHVKTTYTGTASDAMSDAFTPLSDSFNDGANFAGSASLAANFQADSFTTAQSKIQNQVPVPAAPFYEPIDPFSTSHDDAITQNSQIDSANEAAYTAYGNETQSNIGYLQPAPTNPTGFGTFSVTQQGNGTTVGSPAGAAGSPGSASGGRGSSGAASNSRYTANTPSGYVAPPPGTSPSSPPSSPGGSGGVTPPGQTATSGYTPPPSMNPGSGPGTGIPGGGVPIGAGGSPVGAGGGQLGANGPGSVIGPLGGGSLGGGALGGGSSSSVGRGGFGSTGSGEPGAGGSGAGGARSGVGSTAGVGEEAGMGGGAAGAAGRSGASGMGGGMGGRGGRGGEDDEHKTASYLTNEDNGNLIVGDFDPVSPPVIGE